MCRKMICLVSFVLVLALVSKNIALAEVIEIPIATDDDDVALLHVDFGDVTAPGDAIQGVPNDGITYESGNFGWYSWESPDLVIDDRIWTKYLHFKGEIEATGFQVTPTVGPTIVTGLTLTTANDFPGRDPIAFELSGSNVGIDGSYELIASGDIIDFAQGLAWPRFTMNITPISFKNYTAYAHYKLIFPAIRGPIGGSVNSMQIAEVELLGIPAPAPVSINIILITEAIDRDWDGLRDDHSLESFLISEGYSVDVRPEYWNVLTPGKIAELNAADLIIVSRLAWSSRYNQGNETTEWNSLTTPLLQMNSHFARNIRWKWVNSDAREPDGTSYIYAEAVDPYHPVFRGVLTAHEPTDPDGPLNVVQTIDPLIGTGFTAFIDGTDMGNGQLIAKPLGLEMGWIAEWDVGVEFFEGASQYAGGRRMLFCAGTREIRYYDDDREQVITTAQGELNLTVEGLQMFRNAIDYLLGLEITESVVEYVVEDFETNDFSNFPWSSYGDESWETTRSERHSGFFSARSGSIEDGEETSLEVRLDCDFGYITFYHKVSCESGFDELTFYIDGLEQGKWSGQEDWAEVSFYVREGTRTFKWAYSKDSSISEGEDTVWIDDIIFPIGP